jgi:riboflavin kinase / FMN adenylyltransferase
MTRLDRRSDADGDGEISRRLCPGAGGALLTVLADVCARPRRVAIGNFDGVHLGHASIIRGADTVLTFDPHPLAVIAPERAPRLLTDLRAKLELVAELGVRELVVMPFDRTVAAQSAAEFVEEVLIRRLEAVHVSVGSDFRFGANAAGDLATLEACPHFTTSGGSMVRVKGEVVSSTRIRAALRAGSVELAAELLGHPHRSACRVVGVERHRSGRRDLSIARIGLDPTVLHAPGGWYTCRMRGRGRRARWLPCTVRVDGALDGEASLLAGPRLQEGDDLVVEFLESGAEALTTARHAPIAAPGHGGSGLGSAWNGLDGAPANM